jgi:hypothetical protein
MIPPTPRVEIRHGKALSDTFVRQFLDSLVRELGVSVTVHSGDRDHRPKGSPSKSLHLAHRAADFHVRGMTDARAFQLLWQQRSKLSTSVIDRYQIIHHGPHTETEGEHIHIGHYTMLKAYLTGPGITFFTEGVDAFSSGHYKPFAG